MPEINVRDWNVWARILRVRRGSGRAELVAANVGEPVGLGGFAFESFGDWFALYVADGELFLAINGQEWRVAGDHLRCHYRRHFTFEFFTLYEGTTKAFNGRYSRLDVLRSFLDDPSFDGIDQDHAYPLEWLSNVISDPSHQSALIERWRSWRSDQPSKGSE